MAEVATFRLSGWQAAVVAVGVLAWTAWGFARHLQPVPEPAREAMQAWLVDDYTTPDVHHHLLGLANGGASAQGGVSMSVPPPVPTDTAQVAIESVAGHGWKDFQIVRAALTAHVGETAPVHAVRYLSVSRGVTGRWTVVGESTAWRYWWVLVPAPRNGSSWP